MRTILIKQKMLLVILLTVYLISGCKDKNDQEQCKMVEWTSDLQNHFSSADSAGGSVLLSYEDSNTPSNVNPECLVTASFSVTTKHGEIPDCSVFGTVYSGGGQTYRKYLTLNNNTYNGSINTILVGSSYRIKVNFLFPSVGNENQNINYIDSLVNNMSVVFNYSRTE